MATQNSVNNTITGNAGTVTNATLTTALTVNTGTVTLTGNVANNSVLTIGAGAVSVSGSNTGDQTTVSGNAGTATTLQNTRTIWGQNFNGSANVTGDITLGTGNITMTGSLASTGARVTKGWFTDIESTNMPTVGGTALTTVAQTFQNKTITNSNNVLGGVTMTLGSDADGDIYYRASNVLTRLAKGTASQVLTMNAGATAPEWKTPSGAASSCASAGISGDTTTSPIPFDTEQFDTDSYHDNATNNTRLTIPSTAKYLVTANIPFTSDTTRFVKIQLRLNGTTVIGQAGASIGAANAGGLTITGIYSLTAADYLEVLWTTSGGTVTVIAIGTSFTIMRLP